MTTSQSDPFDMLQGLVSALPTEPKSHQERRAYCEEFARSHRAALEALAAIAAGHGGGLAGVAKGLLREYESRQVVTTGDP
jgi:hypothetical protein